MKIESNVFYKSLIQAFKNFFKQKQNLLVLLDIDGVINPFKQNQILEENIVQSNFNKAHIPNKFVNLLRTLSSNKRIKIVWISSWTEESNFINEKFGLDKFEVLDVNPDNSDIYLDGNSFYKFPKILEYLKLNSNKYKEIWIFDDELSNFYFSKNPDLNLNSKTKIWKIDSNVGMDCEEVLKELEKFN